MEIVMFLKGLFTTIMLGALLLSTNTPLRSEESSFARKAWEFLFTKAPWYVDTGWASFAAYFIPKHISKARNATRSYFSLKRQLKLAKSSGIPIDPSFIQKQSSLRKKVLGLGLWTAFDFWAVSSLGQKAYNKFTYPTKYNSH
jgi:hypothetical protein